MVPSFVMVMVYSTVSPADSPMIVSLSTKSSWMSIPTLSVVENVTVADEVVVNGAPNGGVLVTLQYKTNVHKGTG